MPIARSGPLAFLFLAACGGSVAGGTAADSGVRTNEGPDGGADASPDGLSSESGEAAPYSFAGEDAGDAANAGRDIGACDPAVLLLGAPGPDGGESCTFAVPDGPLDPNLVNVVADGIVIPVDATNGWTFDDPQGPGWITLHGKACERHLNDPGGQVELDYGCPVLRR
jgi:hypothetical protein